MTKMKAMLIVFAILIPLMVCAGSEYSVASQKDDCEALAAYVATLKDEALKQSITNVTATWNPAASGFPDYCEVKGRIFPETDFAVRLPSPWEGRLVHFGGGGWDGFVGGPDNTSLNLGYAGSTSNGGHNGLALPPFYSPVFDGSFGLKDPYYAQWIDPNHTQTNPYSCQKIIDFGHRAHRETPLVAKKIIKQYYGVDAHHTYYYGVSTGGREGLVEAQKNYDLFDGVYIGAPTGGHVAVTFRGLWDSVKGEVFRNYLAFPPFNRNLFLDKAIALHDAVYGKCDGIDGLVDGLIDDPRKCNFDPLTDLPKCPNDTDAPGCFTLAQRQALEEIYRGAHNSSGQLYIGTPLSAEYLTDPTDPNSSGFGLALYDILMPDMYKYWAFDPPPGPTWDMMTFNWETDPQIVKASTCTQCYGGTCNTYSLTAELDAVKLSPSVKPNMGGLVPFKNKGGKMIHYHGWSDALVSAFTSTQFYESVLSQMGVAKTKSFYKLYMAPGLGHVAGGIGYLHTWTDAMTALVNWVESGVEPGSLIGTRDANPAWNWPKMTRPLCPYPEVARYLGEGSIYEAANFTCVKTIPAWVRIEPETVKLGSKGTFTAFITLPWGYDVRDREIRSVVCEGAPAVKVTKKGHFYMAKFKTEDLKNITAGEEVTFTVTAIVEHRGHHDHNCHHEDDGYQIAFEGSDMVRVR